VNRQVGTGVVVGVLIALFLVIIGIWTLKGRQDQKAAADRRAIILRGVGGGVK